jgi:hypothetical protein
MRMDQPRSPPTYKHRKPASGAEGFTLEAFSSQPLGSRRKHMRRAVMILAAFTLVTAALLPAPRGYACRLHPTSLLLGRLLVERRLGADGLCRAELLSGPDSGRGCFGRSWQQNLRRRGRVALQPHRRHTSTCTCYPEIYKTFDTK